MKLASASLVTMLFPLAFATACGLVVSFEGYDPDARLLRWHVVGTAEGLENDRARLRLGDEEIVVQDGHFAFETPVQHGDTYRVDLREAPETRACRMEGETGRIDLADARVTLRCVSRATELQLLALDESTLFPSFTPRTRAYSSAVRAPGIFTSETPSARVLAVPARADAKVFVRGVELVPGVLSGPITLSGPSDTVEVEVVAPSGDRGRYSVALTVRAADYLKPFNTHANARFGAAVAFEGNLLVVGAPGDRTLPNKPLATSEIAHGAAYVFEQSLNGTWTQSREVRPDTTTSDPALFGSSVALSNGLAVIGAPGRNGVRLVPLMGTGTHVPELPSTGLAPSARFGAAVAIDGATIAVGAPEAAAEGGSPGTGLVRVFSSNEGTWPMVAELRPATTSWCRFGAALSISGSTLAIGAPDCDGPGRVFLYRLVDGQWAHETTLVGALGSSMPRFGTAVKVEGDLLVVGRTEAQAPGQEQTAYVYRRVQGAWTETATLKPWSPKETLGFGWDIALRGDVAAISSTHSSAVFLFRQDASGWTQHLKIDARAPTDAYSNPWDAYTTVAASLRHLAVGDSRDASSATGINGHHDELAPQSGAVWVY